MQKREKKFEILRQFVDEDLLRQSIRKDFILITIMCKIFLGYVFILYAYITVFTN